MDISIFLIIDAALVITAVPLLFFIKGGNQKASLLQRTKNEELLEKNSIPPPQKGKILEFEKIAKISGSLIEVDELIGNWKFISVWKKNNDEEDSFFSSLLRLFSANIELKKDISTEPPFEFSITVSIRFAIFAIEFSGNAYLEGEQPFLPFLFNLIQLKSGSSILFKRSLKKPLEKGHSFFALISLGESSRWLSARIQSGALILLFKD